MCFTQKVYINIYKFLCRAYHASHPMTAGIDSSPHVTLNWINRMVRWMNLIIHSVTALHFYTHSTFLYPFQFKSPLDFHWTNCQFLMRIIEDIWYSRLSMNVALILDNCLLHRTRDYVKERQRRISEADRRTFF